MKFTTASNGFSAGGTLKLLLVSLGFIGVLLTQLVSAQEQTLLEDGQALKLFKGTDLVPSNWNSIAFDDDSWLDGTVPIGYGEAEFTEPTWMLLPDMRDGYWAVYLRIPFEVPDPDAITSLTLVAEHDDGFAAYLNGIEFARFNLPVDVELEPTTPGVPREWTDPAATATIEPVSDKLVIGTNILAVEIHNDAFDSDDMAFKPKLTAILGVGGEPTGPQFIRGTECDGNPMLNIGDPVYLLRWQFGGFYTEPDCIKACDMDDNGAIDMADAIYGLQYLFASGPPFGQPYPQKGADPTTEGDDLTCVSGEQNLAGE